jgi:hypothetical protein
MIILDSCPTCQVSHTPLYVCLVSLYETHPFPFQNLRRALKGGPPNKEGGADDTEQTCEVSYNANSGKYNYANDGCDKDFICTDLEDSGAPTVESLVFARVRNVTVKRIQGMRKIREPSASPSVSPF